MSLGRIEENELCVAAYHTPPRIARELEIAPQELARTKTMARWEGKSEKKGRESEQKEKNKPGNIICG